MEMTLWMRILAPRTGIALMLALAVAGSSFAAETDFEVLIDEDGVYRVDYEQLQMAGLDSPVASELLAVRSQGEETPIFVVDGGDGLFGPGDYFEMIGSRLVGETSWVHDYARHNVYRLSIDRAGGARMAARGEAAGEGAEASGLRVERHLEEDSMLVRLPGRNASQDSWFWKKLVHNQKAPIGIPLDLSGLDPEGRISVRLGVRGWSKPHNKASKEVADHRLVVRIGQRTILAESWNGSNPHELVLEDAPAAWFDLESPELLLRVPVRRETRDGDRALIDVVMLNWVKVSYSHLAETPARDERLLVDGGEALNLGALEEPVRIYTSSGGRAELQGSGVMPLEPADHAVRVSRQALLKTPVAVLPDSRSSWLEPAQQADYLIVTHQAFKQAIEPLANLHRKRGLKVSVAEVGDLYDEFNHGIAHPRAIRDFVAYASSTWQKPAPRFLLLVGDASWDLKNSEADDSLYADWTYRRGESLNFAKNDSTTYEGGTGRLRHFVPTWQAMTHQGHAASDNYFADIDGENGEPDGMPDLAVGRLPVASVEEVEAILAKIKAYIEEPQAGDWQRKVLLVTNEQSIFQKRSDQLADKLSGEGFLPQKIYPASTEVSNEQHTADLLNSLGSGQLMVHFIGHGGRYIWRTGPPDIAKNHDLFTLDDLDKLPPSKKLPVIVSLTCYSAPFDHPTADSIGEKFLRLEDRGAIGVIAASWRNSPKVRWGTVIFDELTRPGATVGEALQRAKGQLRSRMFRETYNLLGDPAVPIAVPAEVLAAQQAAAELEETAQSAASGAATAPGL